MYVCVGIYAYIYTYTYIHIHIHTYIYIRPFHTPLTAQTHTKQNTKKRRETYKLASTAPFGSNWRESVIFVNDISVTPTSIPSADGRADMYAFAPEDFLYHMYTLAPPAPSLRLPSSLLSVCVCVCVCVCAQMRVCVCVYVHLGAARNLVEVAF